MTISIPLWIIAASTAIIGFILVALAIIGAVFIFTLGKSLRF